MAIMLEMVALELADKRAERAFQAWQAARKFVPGTATEIRTRNEYVETQAAFDEAEKAYDKACRDER